MPSPLSGVVEKLAVKKSVGTGSWGTATTCGALDGVMFLNGQAKQSASVETDNSRGLSIAADGTPGPISCNGSYSANLRYEGLDVVIAMIMGVAGAPTVQGATTAYKNIYKWAADVYGKMVTVAKNMGGLYIEEIPTGKVVGITISGEVGAKPLQVSFEILGNKRETASTVNTTATFANVTIPTPGTGNPVMFSHLVFRMADVAAPGATDATVLASPTHNITPSKFTLSIKRNLKGEYTGQYRTTGSSPQDLIDEPSNDGFPEIKLTLEFATHTGTTYLAALGNDTRKKMDITATSPNDAGAGYKFSHLWQFPHLQLVNVNPTDDNGRIKEPLEFNVLARSTDAAGMTGISPDQPLWWTVVNKRTTDPLA